MATFREMTYMVLDILKEHSDDAYYTEEHVMFLLSRMRAFLLDRKYNKPQRFSPLPVVSYENMQTVCLVLEVANDINGDCNGGWLRSVEKIPDLIFTGQVSVETLSDMLPSNVTFVPYSRMRYVGYNKWLRNIIYCSRSSDGHLYLHGGNPQFMFLDSIKLTGVFSSPEDAAALSCDKTESQCDILDMAFPLESSLISECVEMVVKELLGSKYAPEDKENDARDNLGDAGVQTGAKQKQDDNS